MALSTHKRRGGAAEGAVGGAEGARVALRTHSARGGAAVCALGAIGDAGGARVALRRHCGRGGAAEGAVGGAKGVPRLRGSREGWANGV